MGWGIEGKSKKDVTEMYTCIDCKRIKYYIKKEIRKD